MEAMVALDARVLGRHARRAITALEDHEWVVVVCGRLERTYTAWRAGHLRTVEDDDVLCEVLDRRHGIEVSAWHPDRENDPPPGPTVVVGPDGVLGVRAFDLLEPEEAARGAEPPPPTGPPLEASPPPAASPFPEPPPPSSGGGTTRSWEPRPPSSGGGTTRSWEPPPAEPPATAGPPRSDQPETTAPAPPPSGPPDPGEDVADLTAHPRLAAPEQVTSEADFDLEIGLGREPMGNGDVAAIRIAEVGPTFDIEIQVVAPDFGLPAGGRRFLHVRRDDPTATSVEVPMVAPAVDDARRFTVRVEYVHRGMPIGQAWREVVVTPTDERVEATVDKGAAAVTVSDPGGWADLTVFVSEGEGPDELTWSFFTQHDVAIAEQASRSLDAADAQAFAHEQVLRLGRSAGSDLELAELTGVSRIVADVMPPEFWLALAEVAAVVDERPSLFLVTADPWIPWELASTEDRYLPPEVVDADVPSFLGAQFRVARWLEQRAYGRMVSPAHPPAQQHQVGTFCLVIGDYLAEHGQRPLPAALEEGRQLADRYPHVWRSATAVDLAEVLGDRIRERGEPVRVDALHLACHGRVTDDARASGIVLSDDERTLDPTTIRGSTLAQDAHPFVFLNACQVGQATTVPGGYGGMAGAFVREGASGFVAPLWEVDDLMAQQAALDFYSDTLDAGLEVSEAMRRFRAGFTEGASSRLAYVYYGNPGLRLGRADGPDDDPAGDVDGQDGPNA